MTVLVIGAAGLAVVLAVASVIRRRRTAAAVTLVQSVTPRGPARPRWERHGLRSPASIPRPVQQIDALERERLAAYQRRAVSRAWARRSRSDDCGDF